MAKNGADNDYIPMQTHDRKSSINDRHDKDPEALETTFEPNNSGAENPRAERNKIITESACQLRDATAPQTGREHRLVRLVWLTIYIGLFITFVVSLIQIVNKYRSYPTLIEIEIVSKPRLEFPAVTVCNENPVKKSLIGRIDEYSDLLILDDYVRSTVKTFAQAAFEEIEFEPCPEGHHTCTNTKNCIPPQWICNGRDNCGDKSDESTDTYNCDEIKANRSMGVDSESDGFCLKGYKKCPEEHLCAVTCDGISECHIQTGYDESVEAGCPSTACGENLEATEEPQSFTTEYYPDTYAPHAKCEWVIITNIPDHRIQVTFDELDIEGDLKEFCPDYMVLYNGNSSASKALKVNGERRVCGSVLPNPDSYLSSNESMAVTFDSDGTWNKKGFRLIYQSVPKTAKPRSKRDLTEESTLQKNDRSLDTNNLNEDDFESAQMRTTKFYRKRRNTAVKKLKKRAVARKRSKRDDDYNNDYNDTIGLTTDYDYGNDTTDYNEDYDYDDYDYDCDYDYYYYFDENDPFIDDQFYEYDYGDYYSLYKASTLPDYSDFRRAAYFYQHTVQANGHQLNDFIVQCTFDGKKCLKNGKDFVVFEDPLYGNCFSFNSIMSQNPDKPFKLRSSSKTGHEFGLKLTLFLDYAEYIGLFAPNTGARILVHDPRVRPDLQAESFSVSAGEATFIAVKMEVVDRKGGNYDNCTDNWPETLKLSEETTKKWPTYTQDSCLKFCLINELASRCGCTDSYDEKYSTDAKVNDGAMYYCEMTSKNDSECRNKVYQDFRNHNLACNCPPACHTVEYQFTTSRSPWPSRSYGPYFASKMLKSESDRVSSYMRKLAVQQNTSDNTMHESFKENFVRLEIFYEQLNFRKISESAAYDFSALVSDFGGNIGLWLGWSIFALFELIEFLFHCIRAFLYK